MSNVLVNETSLQNIASAIRTKNGSSDTYTPSEMAAAIENIPSQKCSMLKGGTINFYPGAASIVQIFQNNQEFKQQIDLLANTFVMSTCTSINAFMREQNNITSVDLSNLDLSNVANVSYAFFNCIQLTFIDLRTIDFANKVSFYSSMFGDSANNGPPNNCLIIVADTTQKQWIRSKFSRLTNVKTVAEYGG